MIMKGSKMTDLTRSLHAYLSVIYILTPPIVVSSAEDLETEISPVNYGVLLDAGSSSTKLKIYRWDPSARNSLVPHIDLVTNVRYKPGLSTYEHDDRGLTQHIHEILARAKQEVPSNRHPETPIFLMATAGLRLLSAVDANIFLQKTRNVMANRTNNPFLYTPSSVSILSGEEEGVFSWIAANYLLGFFDKYRPENESVGVLEMGGGSTQIVFIPNGPIFSEEYQVIMAGRPYQLYVQSYLQYGSNSIKLKVAHELAERHPGQVELDSPCMLKGDTRKIRLEDGRFVTETGSGSPLSCLELLREVLKPYTGIRCQPKPCAIGSVYQPSVDNMKFVATQAFTYTPETLKVIGEDEVLHIDKLEEAAIRHCNRSLFEAVNESGISETYASDDCLMGLYIPTLLTVSYGFSRNTTNIRLTSRIGHGRLDWSLGAMLMELSSSFSSTKSQFTVTCKTDTRPVDSVRPGYVKGNNLSTTVHTRPSGIILLSVIILLKSLCFYVFH